VFEANVGNEIFKEIGFFRGKMNMEIIEQKYLPTDEKSNLQVFLFLSQFFCNLL
jgi:hypothetical protein